MFVAVVLELVLLVDALVVVESGLFVVVLSCCVGSGVGAGVIAVAGLVVLRGGAIVVRVGDVVLGRCVACVRLCWWSWRCCYVVGFVSGFAVVTVMMWQFVVGLTDLKSFAVLLSWLCCWLHPEWHGWASALCSGAVSMGIALLAQCNSRWHLAPEGGQGVDVPSFSTVPPEG